MVDRALDFSLLVEVARANGDRRAERLLGLFTQAENRTLAKKILDEPESNDPSVVVFRTLAGVS